MKKNYDAPVISELGNVMSLTQTGGNWGRWGWLQNWGKGQGHNDSNGQGHQSHGNGNGFGHHKRDCGYSG